MSALVEHLCSFNWKERFTPLRHTLGENTFRLDGEFRERLGEKLDVTVPADAFVAMDYHLEWLQMALELTERPWTGEPIDNRNRKLFEGNQRDIDLLVAFEDKTTTHIVMLEAKLETGWTNKQLGEKAERLHRIFGSPPHAGPVEPHFVLLSPKESEHIDSAAWPGWMRQSRRMWQRLPTCDGQASSLSIER